VEGGSKYRVCQQGKGARESPTYVNSLWDVGGGGRGRRAGQEHVIQQGVRGQHYDKQRERVQHCRLLSLWGWDRGQPVACQGGGGAVGNEKGVSAKIGGQHCK
jgi:hypothetical protein